MPLRPNILITGANGFLGSNLVKRLANVTSYCVSGMVRSLPSSGILNTKYIETGDLQEFERWHEALNGVDVVIHAAALAHKSRITYSLYNEVNVKATLALAENALAYGVKRFIFISSIGVNGPISNRPFTEQDMPSPCSDYALSKLEAEQGLIALSRNTDMDIVIIRSPLIYGHRAPGNFARLIRWVKSGLPLPLGAVSQNRRSLIAIDNLVDFIVTCMEHPAAAGHLFLVADGEDVSTAGLLRAVGEAMGRPVRLLPVPQMVLQSCAAVLGKQEVAQQLLCSLQVDTSKAQQVLGWRPPVSLQEGLRRAVSPSPVGADSTI